MGKFERSFYEIKSVPKILLNAKFASKIWNEFLLSINDAEVFKKCFHLRPTANGITIVSTLPYAPMRGKHETQDSTLYVLKNLHEKLPQLIYDTQVDSLNILKEIGFEQRTKSKTLEENMQALLIQGLIKNEPAYNEIQFIASEFNLEHGKRFDVVGVKNMTAYIFELKNERNTRAASQLKGYINHFNTYMRDYESVLRVYPGATVGTINEVKGIVIMPWSANSKTDWEKYKENDIDIWFSDILDDSLSLIK